MRSGVTVVRHLQLKYFDKTIFCYWQLAWLQRKIFRNKSKISNLIMKERGQEQEPRYPHCCTRSLESSDHVGWRGQGTAEYMRVWECNLTSLFISFYIFLLVTLSKVGAAQSWIQCCCRHPFLLTGEKLFQIPGNEVLEIPGHFFQFLFLFCFCWVELSSQSNRTLSRI